MSRMPVILATDVRSPDHRPLSLVPDSPLLWRCRSAAPASNTFVPQVCTTFLHLWELSNNRHSKCIKLTLYGAMLFNHLELQFSRCCCSETPTLPISATTIQSPPHSQPGKVDSKALAATLAHQPTQRSWLMSVAAPSPSLSLRYSSLLLHTGSTPRILQPQVYATNCQPVPTIFSASTLTKPARLFCPAHCHFELIHLHSSTQCFTEACTTFSSFPQYPQRTLTMHLQCLRASAAVAVRPNCTLGNLLSGDLGAKPPFVFELSQNWTTCPSTNLGCRLPQLGIAKLLMPHPLVAAATAANPRYCSSFSAPRLCTPAETVPLTAPTAPSVPSFSSTCHFGLLTL
jgi:hypothetical protein